MTLTVNTEWLRIVNPGCKARLGRIRHALFDFDGTLSVLRQGWEEVMVPVMVESICGSRLLSQAERDAIEAEVRAYVDRSSGILTIRQMQWLVEAVGRYGLAGPARTAGEYKTAYLERLMVQVGERIDCLASGQTSPLENMVEGSQALLSGLAQRGVTLYLASGTDHADVVREASALGLLPYFAGGVYGALDNNENHAKERVIQRILDENQLSGGELLVVGDGPVEIREGARRQALTLGMATDEVLRRGWNPHKIDRLVQAGADLLAPDFSRYPSLLALLFDPQSIQEV